MRKLSPGLTRSAMSYLPKLRGLRLAGSPQVGRLTVPIPRTLIRLLGWYVGQKLKVQVTERGLTLSVRWVPSALHAVPPRKQRAADRLRFQRRWQQALQALRREPNQRRWISVKKRKVPR